MAQERIMKGTECGFHPKFNEDTKETYDVFWYGLTGKAEDIAEYERIQTEAGYEIRRNDKGHPIFFTTNYSGSQCKVKITTNGKVVIDDTDLRKMSSIANRLSGVLQQEVAKEGAKMLLAGLFKSGSSAPEASADSAEVSPEEVDLNEGEE